MKSGGTVSVETAAGFQVELVTKENVCSLAAGLSEMDLLVRGRRLDADFWPWLYFRNPAGAGKTVAAMSGSRVVGKLGRVPLRVSVGGEVLTAELTEGLTLFREFRNWTCFRRLIEASVLIDPANDPPFAFGFSTPQMAKMHASLGQPTLGRVSMFAGVLNGTRMLAERGFPRPAAMAASIVARAVFGLKRKPAASPGIELSEVAGFGKEYDELWRALEPLDGVAVVKDAAYLNWRYVDCPAASYGRLAAHTGGKLAGYIVWRSNGPKGDGYVLELAARDDSEPVLRALLRAALESMARNNVGLVIASFPPGAVCVRALRCAGFGSWAARIKNMSLTVTPGRDGYRPEQPATAWRYTLGDWIYH